MTPRWLRRARAGRPIRPPQRVTAGWWNRAVGEGMAAVQAEVQAAIRRYGLTP